MPVMNYFERKKLLNVQIFLSSCQRSVHATSQAYYGQSMAYSNH